jgi:hypothetical protein
MVKTYATRNPQTPPAISTEESRRLLQRLAIQWHLWVAPGEAGELHEQLVLVVLLASCFAVAKRIEKVIAGKEDLPLCTLHYYGWTATARHGGRSPRRER